MTKEEMLVREIIGPGRNEIRGFACAIQEAKKLLFGERISREDIFVTRDIYPAAASRTNKKEKTAARQIERVGNLCWDSLDKGQKLKYIGKVLNDIRSPQDMIFYLAYYSQYEKPYFEILREEQERFLMAEFDV
ncbi:MAG: hypothetical protein LUC95_11780 [Lachnospiraceae bacterium]|nr:hypothetical protein [Lachnospiraceae bacterium]